MSMTLGIVMTKNTSKENMNEAIMQELLGISSLKRRTYLFIETLLFCLPLVFLDDIFVRFVYALFILLIELFKVKYSNCCFATYYREKE